MSVVERDVAVSPGRATASLAGSVIERLRETFPPRPVGDNWPETAASLEEVLALLRQPRFGTTSKATKMIRVRGARKVMLWLATFPGNTWQQRWLATSAEDTPGLSGWLNEIKPWLEQRDLRFDRAELTTGLLGLASSDVLHQGMAWMFSRNSQYLRVAMMTIRDPGGFEQLKAVVDEELWNGPQGRTAQNKIAVIMAAKGGGVGDITVGDCLELLQAQGEVHRHGGQGRSLFYAWLRALGNFPDTAPATFRNIGRFSGQVSVEQLVDRFGLQSVGVRNVIVDYLAERQAGLDYTSIEHLSRTLASTFWADIERHHPGIDTLHLPREIATDWKQRCQFKKKTKQLPNGTTVIVAVPRMSSNEVLTTVRAFYLDIASWAAESPARWSQWAAPSPINVTEIASRNKHKKQRKARTDQRTRDRLPALPTLMRVVDQRLKDAQTRLRALRATAPGQAFTAAGQTYVKADISSRVNLSTSTRCKDLMERRVELGMAEDRAFWVWAAMGVLRHTGVRLEELLELSHHSIVEYRLPTTGELVPLLQIAPSKTDEERLLLISPELADVLSSIVRRVRDASGAIPLVASYDESERVWNPPLPLLFQWQRGGQVRGISPQTIRRAFAETLESSGMTDNTGQPLRYLPHDFRRMFITDAIMNGLPPHIAQVIVGHKKLTTTMGYNAVYPSQAIEAHRAFVARRRGTRPSEEYRTPTAEEWQEFLGHFEKRKLSVGICARAFGTSCIHEHACVRCSMLRPDPEQRPRLEEIRNNLVDRITEAEQEGWLGEIEGLQVSLAGAEDKLTQIDLELNLTVTTDLGMPSFP